MHLAPCYQGLFVQYKDNFPSQKGSRGYYGVKELLKIDGNFL